MKEKEFNYLAKWGYAYYNRLREFYDNGDRIQLLEYIINYTLIELRYIGKEKDEGLFREKICLKTYKDMKKLYEATIKQYTKDETLPKIIIPTKEEMLKDIKGKYKNLEKRLKEDDTKGPKV